MDGVFEVNTSEKLEYTGPVHCNIGDCRRWDFVHEKAIRNLKNVLRM